MHDDAGDRLSVGEPSVREGPAAVGRLVDADAGHRRAEQVGLAGANPDDVGIRGGDRDVADAGRGVVLEHGLPRRAVVVGLPHAARRVGGVDASRAALFRDGHVGRAPADVGGTKRLPRDSAIRRCLHHRAVGVVRAPQILGVRLRRLLRPEIGRRRTRSPQTEPTKGRECRRGRRASGSFFQRITPHRDTWRAAPQSSRRVDRQA